VSVFLHLTTFIRMSDGFEWVHYDKDDRLCMGSSWAKLQCVTLAPSQNATTTTILLPVTLLTRNPQVKFRNTACTSCKHLTQILKCAIILFVTVITRTNTHQSTEQMTVVSWWHFKVQTSFSHCLNQWLHAARRSTSSSWLSIHFHVCKHIDPELDNNSNQILTYN
jgi:hypothetical protein